MCPRVCGVCTCLCRYLWGFFLSRFHNVVQALPFRGVKEWTCRHKNDNSFLMWIKISRTGWTLQRKVRSPSHLLVQGSSLLIWFKSLEDPGEWSTWILVFFCEVPTKEDISFYWSVAFGFSRIKEKDLIFYKHLFQKCEHKCCIWWAAFSQARKCWYILKSKIPILTIRKLLALAGYIGHILF